MSQRRPLLELVLEQLLERLDHALDRSGSRRVVNAACARRSTPAEILLSDRLQDLPLRRIRAQRFPRERYRFVDGRLRLRRNLEADPPPRLFLRLRPALRLHGRFQITNGPPGARSRYPDVLDVPDRHAHHRFRLACAHLTRANRLVQTRPIPQRLREACHLDRRARRQPEALAGVVADVRVPELVHPVADGERIEHFANRNVQRSVAARHANEERIDQPRKLVASRLVALTRQRPFQEKRSRPKRLEQLVKWRRRGPIFRNEVSFTHPSLIPAPSDIRGSRNLHPSRTRPPPTESNRPAATNHHNSCAPRW